MIKKKKVVKIHLTFLNKKKILNDSQQLHKSSTFLIFRNIYIGITYKREKVILRKRKKLSLKLLLTFSSTVFLIFAPASTTVFPALFTALYKNPPRVLAPARAFVETASREK